MITLVGSCLPTQRSLNLRHGALGADSAGGIHPFRDLICAHTPVFVRAASALTRPALPADIGRTLAMPYRGADRRRGIADFTADIPLQPAHPSHRVLAAIAAKLDELAAVPTLIV